MKKLKTILQSKKVIALLILIVVFRVNSAINNLPYDKNKIGNDKTMTGIVKNINASGENKMLEVKDVIINTAGEFRLGDRIVCVGDISLPSENTNFHLFNYRKFLLSKGIYYQMKAECTLLRNNQYKMYGIKNAIIDIFSKRKSKAYMKAFIIGNTKDIDSDVMANYRKNGVSHLFAISGMHITLIVTVISLLKLNKKTTIIVIPILLFYLFLVDYPPSMVRAVSFFVLVGVNKKLNLNLKNIYLFMYLTVFFLLYRPYFLYNIGFIYSFTISFFLILYSDIFRMEKNKIKKAVLLSAVTFLVSIPISIQNNFYINLLAPVYNLFFIPVISLILFPCAFLVFAFPILDKLYYLCWISIENISLLLTELNTIIVLCYMEWYVIVCYYVIIIFIMHKIKLREYIYIVLIFLLLLGHHLYPYVRNKGIIMMLDVGQGDSVLIIYPHNQLVILVDTGGNLYSNRIAEDIIIPTLYSLGIKKIDYLILTHGDYDHVGEALSLLSKIKVGKTLLNSGSFTPDEIDIIDYMRLKNIDYNLISRTVLNVNGNELNFLSSVKVNDENEDSLVLLLEINKKRFLLMGDSGIKTEMEILNEYNLTDVDILKIGHHGSKNSTNQVFIDRINPQISLISAGKNNIYGHPHPEVLNKLQFCDTYITSIDGAVKITIGKSILVTTVR